jgi:enoyl-CoA hydratase/carnithine racemase
MSSWEQGLERLRVEREGDVMIATLNRPDVLNAVDHQMHVELTELLERVDEDDSTSVIVLTGAGRAFCSGGDVSRMSSGGGSALKRRKDAVRTPGSHLIAAFLALEKPIVAMVNGPAVGLGATIALICDAVFMASSARIGDTHVRVGLVAGDGGSVLWPLLIGPMRAKEVLMTGRLLAAEEAERIGLVTRMVPDAELKERTLEFARLLADQPPFSLRATKSAINRAVSLLARDSLDLALAWERISASSDEHREAVARWMAGRAKPGTASK